MLPSWQAHGTRGLATRCDSCERFADVVCYNWCVWGMHAMHAPSCTPRPATRTIVTHLCRHRPTGRWQFSEHCVRLAATCLPVSYDRRIVKGQDVVAHGPARHCRGAWCMACGLVWVTGTETQRAPSTRPCTIAPAHMLQTCGAHTLGAVAAPRKNVLCFVRDEATKSNSYRIELSAPRTTSALCPANST